LKAFKQYDQARIEKLTQIAALNSLPLLAVLRSRQAPPRRCRFQRGFGRPQRQRQ